MSNIIDIEKHTPKSGDNYFFDTNVWLFNFCPIAGSSKQQQKVYSSFLSEVKTARATIFTNSLIVSEFANRFLRLDFELWQKNTNERRLSSPNFKKDYIPSQQYKKIVLEVEKAINKILSISEIRSDDFNRIGSDLSVVYNHFKIIDFNDSYFYEFCKNNDYILVSDDQDFKKIDDNSVKIITLPRI